MATFLTTAAAVAPPPVNSGSGIRTRLQKLSAPAITTFNLDECILFAKSEDEVGHCMQIADELKPEMTTAGHPSESFNLNGLDGLDELDACILAAENEVSFLVLFIAVYTLSGRTFAGNDAYPRRRTRYRHAFRCGMRCKCARNSSPRSLHVRPPVNCRQGDMPPMEHGYRDTSPQLRPCSTQISFTRTCRPSDRNSRLLLLLWNNPLR